MTKPLTIIRPSHRVSHRKVGEEPSHVYLEAQLQYREAKDDYLAGLTDHVVHGTSFPRRALQRLVNARNHYDQCSPVPVACASWLVDACDYARNEKGD